MDENKLYIIFTVVIGLCALLSPMLVANANNKHQVELKKLEIDSQQSKKAKEVVDNYFKYAGAAIGEATTETYTQFGKYSSLIYFYIPEQYHRTISVINKYILQDYDRNKARETLEQLARTYSKKA